MTVTIAPCDPASDAARAMAAALWGEIQARYGFQAPDPFDPAAFTGPVGGFWLAADDAGPVGSVALAPFRGTAAELDVMYVAPAHRGTGVAQTLLAAALDHARAAGMDSVRLRAGEPQPEALRFYARAGFRPIEPFGHWVDDPTARCFELALD